MTTIPFLRCIIIAMGLIALAGCDPEPAPPPPRSATQPAPALAPAKPRPTTQALLLGPRRTVQLGKAPLSVEVPEGWDLQALAHGDVLSGPSPGGEVRLIISQFMHQNEPMPFSAETIRILAENASKRQQASPQLVQLVDLRNLGSARILEERTLEPARPESRSETGEVMAATPPILRWSLTIYTPAKSGFVAWRISTVGLTAQQYEQDRGFLEETFKTLRYEPPIDAGGL